MSLVTELFNTLDKGSLSEIADSFGEPEQSVVRGMQAAIATVLGGMAANSDNPTVLRSSLELTPTGNGDVSWSNIVEDIENPNSPVIAAGKRILSTLFGGSENAIVRALGTGTGLQPGVASSLLAVATPIVMGSFKRRVREEGMTMGRLGTLLERETPAIRAALPAGVIDLIWPRGRETAAASPVVAQEVSTQRSPAVWLVPVLLLALIPTLFWLFHHERRPISGTPAAGIGSANRMMPDSSKDSKAIVPKNIDLYFETGSAALRPESDARLDELVVVMKNNQNLQGIVSGYTDNVGSAASNLRLSQKRAEAVKTALAGRGVDADRLSAQGFGEETPIADNSTAEGRGTNRRVSVGVEQH
jgi:OmpA-OmpF porin, OOP family